MKDITSLKKIERESQEIERYRFVGGVVSIFSQKRPGDESRENEDCCAVLPLSSDRGICIVADGMGGHQKGREASQLAIDCVMREVLQQKDDLDRISGAIMRGIELAHEEIKALKMGAGTTLSVADISATKVKFYNVGDSVTYLIGARGTLKYKNIEHSPVAYGVEAGLISDNKAIEHEDSNILLYALGLDDLRIEVSGFLDMAPLDTVFLASDGLTSNIKHEHFLNLVTKGPASARLAKIISFANQQMHKVEAPYGHPDDLTMISFRRTLSKASVKNL